MTQHFKSLALAGGLVLGGVVGASAATLDFTDIDSYTFSTSEISGTFQGVNWKLLPAGEGGDLTQNVPYDGDAAGKAALMASSGLALEGDGIGIDDDEVSYFEAGAGGREVLRLVFERTVYITGVHFLDLFGDEFVRVVADTLPGALLVGAESAAGDNSTGGYAWDGDPNDGAWIQVLRFAPGRFNDSPGGVGNPDFALAGIDIAAVPLPAGGLLLLTALGGLGLAARRRKA